MAVCQMSVIPSKIALFIDGANLYATAKALGFDVDYKRVLQEFCGRGQLLRAFYYTAILDGQDYSSLRPLTDWLDYNGYAVVTKAVKEFVDASCRRKVKGNMDIELAVDAKDLAEQIDQMFLFSGDGDFRSLVEAVQRRGVRVTVVSTMISHPPMVTDELRRQADASSISQNSGQRLIGYPSSGDFSDAKLIRKFGDVPDDLSACLQRSSFRGPAGDLLAGEGQAHAGDDVVPSVLFFGGIVDQYAMDQPPREVAAVVPNLVTLVAGNREEARRHSLVLNS
jgi:uncharacterized LabA/DUF88 family protein